MGTYRVRQKTVEAVQYTGRNAYEVINTFGPEGLSEIPTGRGTRLGLFVHTLQAGATFADPGDWIVRTYTPGRFFLCRPDTFAATYELVPDELPAEESEIRVLLGAALALISGVSGGKWGKQPISWRNPARSWMERYEAFLRMEGDPDGVGARHDGNPNGPDAQPEGDPGEATPGGDPRQG